MRTVIPTFFKDIITIFSGNSSENDFGADLSIVLYPFPTVPMMICYWKPEDELDSWLHLYFDDTAEKNLAIESLYSVGMGFTRILDKIVQKHSVR